MGGERASDSACSGSVRRQRRGLAGPLKVYTEMEGVLADVTPVTRTERSSHTEEIKQFVNAVQTRGESPVPVEDGLALVSILEAIRRSSDEGREVEIEAGI